MSTFFGILGAITGLAGVVFEVGGQSGSPADAIGWVCIAVSTLCAALAGLFG